MIRLLRNRFEKLFGEGSRFLIVGVIGVFLTWISYNVIYLMMPLSPRATLSWAANFLPSVAIVHHLHRRFTFRISGEGYLSELFRSYFGYAGVAALTTVIHHQLTEFQGVNHQLSWFISTSCSVIVNFIILKTFVFNSRTKGGTSIDM